MNDKGIIVETTESGESNIEIVRKLNCPEFTAQNIKRNSEETKKGLALAKKDFVSVVITTPSASFIPLK